jgi:hypothetical protein
MSRPGARSFSVEDQLALLLVSTAERRHAAAEHIAELSSEADESRLLATLMRQRILLLAGGRRLEVAPATVSEAFRARIEDARSLSRVRAMAFSTVTAHLTATLEDEGIPAIALKGGALSEDVHGDDSIREYDDIDVLVPAADLPRAATRAGTLGWTIPDPANRNSPLHRVLLHAHGAPMLELHWRIHWYENRFAAKLIERSDVVDGRRRLDPCDQFAALLLYYARDGFAGLRLAADVAAWWDIYGTLSILDELDRRLQEHPPLRSAWRTALAVAIEVAGLRVPRPAARSRREALARRLANWDLRGDPDQITANVTLVDGLLTPAGGRRAFLRRRFAAAGIVRTLSRYLLAIWYVRGGRIWSPIPRIPAGPFSASRT